MTQPPQSDLFSLRQISEHVYWLPPNAATDRPILGAVVGHSDTLAVEAGNSTAHARLFLGQLEKNHLPPPCFLTATHWHWDHVFGAEAFRVPYFATAETRRIVSEMAGLDWSDAALDARVQAGAEIEFCSVNIKAELPDRSGLNILPPNIGYTAPIEIGLGGVTACLIPVGGDHSSDSSVIYIPEDKILFLGDCHYMDLYSGPLSYTTRKLFPLLDLLLSLEVDYYLGAHESEPISRQQMLASAAQMKTIGRRVDEIGLDRTAVLASLPGPLDADTLEIADAFLAGLTKQGRE
jgi:glyoxylase-like metal-dependent hydrolase (beta-lactamase superfamily II)